MFIKHDSAAWNVNLGPQYTLLCWFGLCYRDVRNEFTFIAIVFQRDAKCGDVCMLCCLIQSRVKCWISFDTVCV